VYIRARIEAGQSAAAGKIPAQWFLFRAKVYRLNASILSEANADGHMASTVAPLVGRSLKRATV